MSVSGISSSNLFDYVTQSVQTRKQQFQQEVQQLGQDLQSGNLSAAQADFATLQQLGPKTSSTSSTSSAQSSNPIAQAFNQLAQDLKSGNVAAAQQDFSTIQKDVQNQAGQMHNHHHHHLSGSASSGTSAIDQLLTQLGQSLQAGNLSAAQQAYSTLLEDFQQFSQTNGLSPASSPSSSNSLSVTA
jgi:hypothetical protein